MKVKAFWAVLLFVTALQAVCSVAFALDLPSLAPPVDDKAALGLAQQVWQLFVTKQYALALGPVVALLVFALRRYDGMIPKYGAQIDAFINKPFVSFLLPTIVAAVGGLGTALAAGKPPLDAAGAVFQAAMGAVFTYVGLKKIGEQQQAGTAAAAAVDSKAAAITELKKP